jgi:hypothetical protein
MGKYTDNQSDIFSIFDAFKSAEGIETVPRDYKGDIDAEEYVRVSIVPSGNGINLVSSHGVVIAEIYTPAGFGPSRQNFIADRLDAHLVGKTHGMTQFLASTLSPLGTDRDNASLQCAKYEIPFNFFGVLG